jgi:hypothetical protein
MYTIVFPLIPLVGNLTFGLTYNHSHNPANISTMMNMGDKTGESKDDASIHNLISSAPTLSVSHNEEKHEGVTRFHGALENNNIRISPTIYVTFMPQSDQSEVFPQISISELKKVTVIDNYTISFPENEWLEWPTKDKERLLLELKAVGWAVHFQRINHIGLSEVGLAKHSISDDSITLPLLIPRDEPQGSTLKDIADPQATENNAVSIKYTSVSKFVKTVKSKLDEDTTPEKVTPEVKEEPSTHKSGIRTGTNRVLGFGIGLAIRKRPAEGPVAIKEERSPKAHRVGDDPEERKKD